MLYSFNAISQQGKVEFDNLENEPEVATACQWANASLLDKVEEWTMVRNTLAWLYKACSDES